MRLFAGRMAAALLAGLLLGFALRPVPAAAEEEPEVDRLEVAALLLRDGQYGRAAKVLAEIDPEAESVDQARYHTLYGLALLEEKDFDGAGDHFEAALDAGATQPQIVLRLAQARFEAGRYREVIAALDRGGAPVDALPAAHLLRAQAYWRAGDTAAAYAALETGLARHPDEARLLEQEILLLLEMKLFQAARAKAERFLRRAGASADDFVLVAEATRRAGAADEAIVQLEEARLRFPRSERVAVALARAYVEAGRPLAAAVVLQEASRFHPRLAGESAELYRRAGRYVRALHMNAQVRDAKEKTRQRLGILIDMAAFERAAALEPRLRRLGLLEDEKIRYALAYAAFKNGEYARAERHLAGLSDPTLFAKGIELRRAMEACRKSGARCL